MQKRTKYFCLAAVFLGFCYLHNASWLARPPAPRLTLLAHRGVHQGSACKNVERDTCTASCITVPTHDYLENTIRSMRAAFDVGAEVVELDVHPTTDGDFAVFHDWTLECRTNGSGVTRERSMTYLKTLDLGHGYSADGGRTFPFRGKGIGLIPTLNEVLDTFPEHRLLINIKSNDPSEGELLARYLLARPEAQRRRLMVYGGKWPVDRVLSLVPGLRGLSRESAIACATRYAFVGWSGYLPSACRNTLLILPENRARLLWGWPHRFIARMQTVGTDVYVAASTEGSWLLGIDSEAELERIAADDYSGGIWTDRIETLGPWIARQR
jgi:glycerophosphoryl diester phosphodiesterase